MTIHQRAGNKNEFVESRYASLEGAMMTSGKDMETIATWNLVSVGGEQRPRIVWISFVLPKGADTKR